MIPVINDEDFRIYETIGGEYLFLAVVRLFLLVDYFLFAVLGTQSKNPDAVLLGYIHQSVEKPQFAI